MTTDQIIISCLGGVFVILFGIISWTVSGAFKRLGHLEDKFQAHQVMLASDYTKTHDLKFDIVKIEQALESIDNKLARLSEEVVRIKAANYVPRDER